MIEFVKPVPVLNQENCSIKMIVSHFALAIEKITRKLSFGFGNCLICS